MWRSISPRRGLGHLQPAATPPGCIGSITHVPAQGVESLGQSEASLNAMLSQSRGALSLGAQKNAQQEAASPRGLELGWSGNCYYGVCWWVSVLLIHLTTPQAPNPHSGVGWHLWAEMAEIFNSYEY